MSQVHASKAEGRIAELGHKVPAPPKPAANYIPWSILGSTIYIAGQVPMVDGAVGATGHVGREHTIESAQKWAAVCALNGIANLKAAAASRNKTLDSIRIVKVGVFVAAAPKFTDIHKVANGASDFLAAVFGENGKHARSAVGVAELPLGVPVEVELTAELL
jgi:enamine deaminase RidA (YjgF/YER057c/UK114 family)